MGFMNKKQLKALLTKDYTCPECGSKLHFEDEYEDVLVCDNCGYDVDSDRYGISDEEYDSLYPREDD